MYTLTLKTPPSIEPISLNEIKDYLKISDYGDTCDGLTIEESILIATRSPAIVNGDYVDVLGYTAIVELSVGEILATGTLDVKVQESNDHATWEDYYSFTQVTPANDNQTFKYEYAGDKQYIRVVATSTLADATYSVNIILNQGYTDEDTYLSSLITAAREYCEGYQNRAYITQTWELGLDYFSDVIEVPKGNLQTIDSIEYTNSSNVTTTLTESTDYVVSTRGILGRVVPAYNKSWPSFTPCPLDPIIVTFTCGYGTASNVPEKVIQAMKLLISHWFTNRTPIDNTRSEPKEISFTLSALLCQDRIVIL